MNDSIIRTRYADALVKYVQETGNGKSVCKQAEKLSRVLKEVPDLSRMIAAKDVVPDAKAQAQEEAAKILADARTEIAAEKEAALRDVRKEVAVLSVSIAEKILRKELSDEDVQRDYIDRMVDETVRDEAHS